MKLRLSADSRPAATVITDADAPPAVAFAARELSRYLAIITGGRYPIVEGEAAGGRAPVLRLRTGTAPHPPAPSPSRRGGDGPPRGAYSWRVDDGGVEIVGERPGAVLHAAYALLEGLGCAWLHVWEGGEIIPRTPTVELPWGEHIAEPAMAHREFTNLMPINEGYVHHIDWMAKNRFNRFMVFANIAGSIDRYLELLEPEVAVRGMQATMGHHSFRYFLPPEEHFADHPEWYALLDGERSPHGQLCTSNPEVVDTVADRICEFLASHEQIEMVGLWPNDGYGWCECEACASLQPQRPSRLCPEHPRRTDTYLHFVNAVAERVAAEHPDRRLGALAYVNYVEAPEAIEPAENVAVCYAPFCRCLKHPLRPDVDCDRPNAEYARELERWREVVANDLYLFCYLMQIHTLSVPYRITHMLQPNWRWLIEAGCDGYVMEFVPEEWATFGLNAHLTGRLSWEPEMDVDAWLSAYYRHLYGPAADSMEAWFRILEDSVRVAGPCTGHYDLTYAARATEDLLRSGLEVFGRARAEAATGDRRHWRAAQQAWVGLELLMRLGRWQRLLLEAREAPEPRRGPLMHRAADAAGDVLAFVRDHADSGAVESDRYERIVGGWLDEQS